LVGSGDLFGLTEVTSNWGVCDWAIPMDAASASPSNFRFMAFRPFGHINAKKLRLSDFGRRFRLPKPDDDGMRGY
jgi:hypothetical protein